MPERSSVLGEASWLTGHRDPRIRQCTAHARTAFAYHDLYRAIGSEGMGRWRHGDER